MNLKCILLRERWQSENAIYILLLSVHENQDKVKL